nr:IS4 family transposase [Methanobrevibacter smithii]
MFLSRIVSDEFGNFNNFVERKYVLSDVDFTRKGKLSLESMIKYPLCNNKKTTSIEINRFLRNELNDRGVRITKQAVSEKRQFIDPQVYIDMNGSLISKIYAHKDEMTTFKGFNVYAIDGSIVEIPNTKLTREEFEIPEKTELMKDTSTARISCMADTKWDFIISSNITNKSTSEIEHALMHLDDVKNKIDLTKTITTYDRFYNSIEIMFKTMLLDSYFIICGKTHTFKKQQNKMKKEGKTDETHEINNFFTEEVKKFARKTREIKVRIVFVKLKTGETETLFTNLPKEIATPEELKELYGTRWTIEKNYDRLKNKLHIEKFTGKKKIIIEQDFYSHIYLLNMLISLKHDADEEITRKPKETTKYKYVYKSNVNTLIGNIKEEMPRLLTDDKEEIKQIVEEILDIARKDLVYTKIKAPTNKERDKKKYYHKKCKSNIQNSF